MLFTRLRRAVSAALLSSSAAITAELAIVAWACLTSATGAVPDMVGPPGGPDPAGPPGGPVLEGTIPVRGHVDGTVLTAAMDVTDKPALFARTAAAAASAPGPAGHPRRLNHNILLMAEGEQAVSVPGGGAGTLRASGASLALAPFWDTEKHTVTYVNSSSQVAWLGARPFHADKIIHAESWVTDIYGGAATITGGPPGALPDESGTLRWETEVAGNWFSRHSWAEPIVVAAQGATYQVGFRVTGTFQFGSSFFVVTGGERGGI